MLRTEAVTRTYAEEWVRDIKGEANHLAQFVEKFSVQAESPRAPRVLPAGERPEGRDDGEGHRERPVLVSRSRRQRGLGVSTARVPRRRGATLRRPRADARGHSSRPRLPELTEPGPMGAEDDESTLPSGTRTQAICRFSRASPEAGRSACAERRGCRTDPGRPTLPRSAGRLIGEPWRVVRAMVQLPAGVPRASRMESATRRSSTSKRQLVNGIEDRPDTWISLLRPARTARHRA